MAELKKCPFCGGEAEIRELVDRDIHGYNIGIRYMVGCIDDDGRCCMNIETGAYRKAEDAIAHWNNRVTEAEIRAKAIDEFAEKLKYEFNGNIFTDEEKFKYAKKEQEQICAQNMSWKRAIKYVDYFAEQLKGE